ncbi:hypothetical protein KIL84_011409 [Mauremys mutica]|uniref:Uncharacterized protein n=1 Tax=Mauremys mutica TaxID=74926 RepID=A0A9D3XDP7_9SAUR|nr:hypothetical protein KIL84_011409 [Mauremys mutica]
MSCAGTRLPPPFDRGGSGLCSALVWGWREIWKGRARNRARRHFPPQPQRQAAMAAPGLREHVRQSRPETRQPSTGRDVGNEGHQARDRMAGGVSQALTLKELT